MRYCAHYIHITYAFANKMKVEQVVANTLNRQHIVSKDIYY